MKGIRLFFCIIGFILFLSLANASFQVDKNISFISKSYTGGETIKGKLNMSFSNQNGNSVFTSNFGTGENLLDVLGAMSYQRGIDFTCSPATCDKKYIVDGTGAATRNFNLNEKRYFGFKITGNNTKILSGGTSGKEGFDFQITGYEQASCNNQVFVDMFDDGKIDFYNDHYAEGELCGEEIKGCFDGNPDANYTLEGQAYCEKVKLPAAPAYEIGANLHIEEEGGNVFLGLFDMNGTIFCDSLDKSGKQIYPDEGGNRVITGCGSMYETEAYVCAAKGANELGTVTIGGESDENSCGTRLETDDLVQTGADYDLFVQPLAYDAFGTIPVAEVFKSVNGINLWAAADDYINRTYKRNCENGCVIPFSIWLGKSSEPGSNQQIDLSAAGIKYERKQGATTETSFYSITSGDPLVSSGYRVIDLEKVGLTAPNVNGTNLFKIYLGDQKVFEETVSTKLGLEFDMAPKFSLIGEQTTFFVTGLSNVSSTSWNFGDGSTPVISNGLSATHAYMNNGTYSLELQVKNSGGEMSTRRFKIGVGDPKISLGALIDDYSQRIANLKKDLEIFPTWVVTDVKKKMELDSIESNLTLIDSKFKALTSNANQSAYISLIGQILKFDLPERIFTSERTTLPGEIGIEKMNPSYAATINDEYVNDSSATKKAILAWMDKNYEFDISFEGVSGRVGAEQSVLFRKYKIDVKPKGTSSNQAYLIIGYPASTMAFKPDNEVKSGVNNASVYAILSGAGPWSYEFLIYGNTLPNAEDLGVFISPALADLEINIQKPYGGIEDLSFPWKFFLMWIGIILAIILVAYLVLQWWYKKNYEKYLFKNPGDLYNIINFIYNSRRSGLTDDEIRSRLLQSRWKGEQVSYAFKKIDGKRTGMWEIPIFKFAENRKVKREIQNRQNGPVDARFIKRGS
jgi:hypothetical protein